MEVTSYLLGKKSSGGGSTGGLNWASIGYTGTPQILSYGYDYAQTIYDNWEEELEYIGDDLSYFFSDSSDLVFMPLVDTSTITNFDSVFSGCSGLIHVPQLNTSDGTNFGNMFFHCTALRYAPQLDLSKGASFKSMFEGCVDLAEVPQLDMSSAYAIDNIFKGCSSLATLGNLVNLGKAYDTSKPANYYEYTLDLSDTGVADSEEILNIVNSLYDIASKGCNTQSLIFPIPAEDLPSEIITLASSKGWTIS